MAKKKTKKGRHGHKERVHCVVKRGRKECSPFDRKKVYGSVYAACYIVHVRGRQCEKIADAVMKKVVKFVHGKKEVTSKQIANETTKELRKHSKDAAFMYETHRDIA